MLNIAHTVNIITNAFSVRVLVYCNQVYVCKLTVELSIICNYWAQILYFGFGRFSFSLALVSV